MTDRSTHSILAMSDEQGRVEEGKGMSGSETITNTTKNKETNTWQKQSRCNIVRLAVKVINKTKKSWQQDANNEMTSNERRRIQTLSQSQTTQ